MTCIGRNLKETILRGNIRWSAIRNKIYTQTTHTIKFYALAEQTDELHLYDLCLVKQSEG